MDITNLTKEQRAELLAQLSEEKKREEALVQQRRESYKELVDDTVKESVKKLTALSAEMMRVKQEVFDSFATLIKAKNELYRVKLKRHSDSFTSSDGSMCVTLGNRTNEGWDDTVKAGIEMVKEYMASLATNEETAILIETIMGLLSQSKGSKGTLKANKVLELERLAVKSQDTKFLEGIKVIKDAYRPIPTCQFISVKLKNKEGKEEQLPLSLSNM
ncbi:MAG: DUF3164 family protein [Prevotella sp.]|nr:DUF3164 family protein [Prevotella sp.]